MTSFDRIQKKAWALYKQSEHVKKMEKAWKKASRRFELTPSKVNKRFSEAAQRRYLAAVRKLEKLKKI